MPAALTRFSLLALFLFLGSAASAQTPPANDRYVEDVTSRFLREHYEGGWKDGKRNGHGVLLVAGNRYEGDFQDGKRNGRGVLLRADGARYDGQWENDLMHGQGIFMRPDGQRYEGGFAKGAFNGQGVYFYPKGDRCEGQWAKDRFGEVALESGTCLMANGDRYEGVLGDYGGLDLIPNGLGVFTRRDGSVLSGTWSGGCLKPDQTICVLKPVSSGGPVR
jgi:hypothetical protein